MKLLDIMKKYDRCLVRESAKLTKIYNMILRESEADDSKLDEEVCPDCGNDPCTCEAEEIVNAEDLFSETDDVECDESEDLIPEEDFIKDVKENDMLRNRPHNAHIDDPKGVVSEEEMISAEDFFSEAEEDKECDEEDKECDESEETNPKFKMRSAKEDLTEGDNCDKDDADCDEAEEMMSAEEFFAEAEKDCDEAEEMMSAEDFFKESDNDKECDEAEFKMISAKELLAEKDEDDEEKKLQESLKSYRRKNHRLFNN